MKIEKKIIGEEMKRLLTKGYNTEKISDWAEDLLIDLQEESPIYLILNRLSVMAAGPEFEYTEKELSILADMLINEVDDPIEQINNIKFKK